MTLALRAIIVGIAVAMLVEWLFDPHIVGLFISFVAGVAFGMLLCWVSWPWMNGPE